MQSHSGVAVAGAANVAVPVDDLRPRVKNVQITLDAVDDIRFCEKLFDKWMTELDKCVASLFSRRGFLGLVSHLMSITCLQIPERL